jgi:hypothetical protein
MSTWQQHTLSNNTNQPGINSDTNNDSKSVEITDELGEINHTSALSGDFGM